MTAILAILYGAFLVMIGVRGNAIPFVNALSQEGQFIYWILVLLVVAALWESELGEGVAKPLVILILVGFLLKNWTTIATNAKQVLPS